MQKLVLLTRTGGAGGLSSNSPLLDIIPDYKTLVKKKDNVDLRKAMPEAEGQRKFKKNGINCLKTQIMIHCNQEQILTVNTLALQ